MPTIRKKQRSLVFPAIGAAALAVLAAATLRRARKVGKVCPELRSAAMIAVPPIVPALVPLIQRAIRKRKETAPAGVRVDEYHVRSRFGGPNVRVVRLRRAVGGDRGPALLWLHGGGYLIGTPEIDFALLARILEGIDLTIFSVDYRLAPEHPFPAPLDDAMSVLEWLAESGAELGIDGRTLCVGGNSAGGGLAAALAQRAHDADIPVAFQLLMYPMLDDRTVCRKDHGGRGELVWTQRDNRHGWSAYLGGDPGKDDLPRYAAPARRERLTGLAPAWIGVGSLDLFYEENVRYGERLRESGVHCELTVVAGAPHGFDLFNFETATARTFHDSMIAALASACGS
jgi:acetyl esterase/lipase